MGLHAHCLVVALLAIILTSLGLRIPYMCMISLFFYLASVVINLLSSLHDKGRFSNLILNILIKLIIILF